MEQLTYIQAQIKYLTECLDILILASYPGEMTQDRIESVERISARIDALKELEANAQHLAELLKKKVA